MDVNKLLEIIKQKTDMRMQRLDPTSHEFERAYAIDGMYTDEKIDFYKLHLYCDWTRSFFTGMNAYMYHHFKDEKYLKYLEDSFDVYEAFYKRTLNKHYMTHDAGFLYMLYSTAFYAVSGNEKAKNLTYLATNEYLKRFSFKAGVIHGFGSVEYPTVQVIIEDMMNLSLLMWAYRQTGHLFYKQVLKSHIDRVLDVMLREDNTFIQSYVFDVATGEPKGERNYRGYGLGSVWSRGHAWAIYGLINMVNCVGPDEKYMKALNDTVNKFISYLPDDGIPLWDFSCTEQEDVMIDTSAGAIFASAMYKMSHTVDISSMEGEAKNAVAIADRIMDTISEKYLSRPEHEPIIDNCHNAGMNVSCVWGDYFFTEAVMRKVYGKQCPDFWN